MNQAYTSKLPSINARSREKSPRIPRKLVHS